MKTKNGTDLVIAEMISAMHGKQMSPREKRLLKESLHGLVRLAKSELLFEMKTNVHRLTGIGSSRTRQGRSGSKMPYQQRFEFNPFE